MRIPRVLCEEATSRPRGETVDLHCEAARHLRDVLRLRDGARLELTDGAGGTVEAVLLGGGAQISADWSRWPRPSNVVLHPGLSKGRKIDLVVEKATELGIAQIAPVVTERTQRRWDAGVLAKRLHRWRQIARSALEQSHGAWLPELRPPIGFADLVEGTPPGIILDPSGAAVDWTSEIAQRVVVGPEGGFTRDETDAAVTRGWQVGCLGPTVLRTETAAIVGAALAIHGRAEWNRAGREDQH